MPFESFLRLISRLETQAVRFVVIGVSAANYYARSATEVFSTQDRDLFVPRDSSNLLAAWMASREEGYELWTGDEPLGEPIDTWLAERMVERRAATSAIHPDGITVDFTLEMAGFEFETVKQACRLFRVEATEIPVARLAHIVESKRLANRPKDRLFLETWRERLAEMLDEDESGQRE
jgi:hypothetical protein